MASFTPLPPEPVVALWEIDKQPLPPPDPEIVDFGGPRGPSPPQIPPEKVGVDFLGGEAPLDIKIRGFPDP